VPLRTGVPIDLQTDIAEIERFRDAVLRII
jgi:hypothetical protein